MSQSDIEVIVYRLSAIEKKIDESIIERRERDAFFDKRVREIESTIDQLRGAGAAGKAMWAFIGAGGLSVIVGIASLLMSKK